MSKKGTAKKVLAAAAAVVSGLTAVVGLTDDQPAPSTPRATSQSGGFEELCSQSDRALHQIAAKLGIRDHGEMKIDELIGAILVYLEADQ